MAQNHLTLTLESCLVERRERWGEKEREKGNREGEEERKKTTLSCAGIKIPRPMDSDYGVGTAWGNGAGWLGGRRQKGKIGTTVIA